MIFHPCRYKKASELQENDYVVGIAGCREVGGAPEFVLDTMGNKEYVGELADVKLDETFIDTDRFI